MRERYQNLFEVMPGTAGSAQPQGPRRARSTGPFVLTSSHGAGFRIDVTTGENVWGPI
jgi:hypothetical protein